MCYGLSLLCEKMEVKHQAAKALRISGCLKDTIWNNKHLRREVKVGVYIYDFTCLTYFNNSENNTNLGSSRNEDSKKNFEFNTVRQGEK